MKDVSRINIDALLKLPTTCPETVTVCRHAAGWLSEDVRYRTVRRRAANGAPRAKLSDEQVAALLQHGVVRRIPRSAVKGWVRMFTVPEAAKRRFRPIKHTADVNDALGKESLLKLRFPSKASLVGLVHHGTHAIALDFAAYFDQFLYTESIGEMFCFRHGQDYFCLRTLAMGQRQAVEVAATTTALLLDFPGRRTHVEACIDNVIFVGSEEDVLRDAREFVARVRAVNGQLNENVDDLPSLVAQRVDWCGVALNFVDKSVALTKKTLEKVAISWGQRASWSWRGFAAHVGLLFWAWGILDLPMAEFFPLLSFVSRVGRSMTEDESQWDAPAFIWDSVWPVLDRWTGMLSANAPRTVPRVRTPEWLVMTDASRWGWGYVALNEVSGELRHSGAPWSDFMEHTHGDKLGSSVFAEPFGVLFSLRHLLQRGSTARVRLATDNTATQASFQRGFNARSPAINWCIAEMRRSFPQLAIDFIYVAGSSNLADTFSRGGFIGRAEEAGMAGSLRRLVGATHQQL